VQSIVVYNERTFKENLWILLTRDLFQFHLKQWKNIFKVEMKATSDFFIHKASVGEDAINIKE